MNPSDLFDLCNQVGPSKNATLQNLKITYNPKTYRNGAEVAVVV